MESAEFRQDGTAITTRAFLTVPDAGGGASRSSTAAHGLTPIAFDVQDTTATTGKMDTTEKPTIRSTRERITSAAARSTGPG
ncbi:hypothetical protein AB0D04_14100 [Streptomyces sp. NPDC048483]|uniref:hypothetical protein n=1 Tax=Streptomyces sp. NPDC048483 TaxID=3154927 RepID=UPI003444FFCF